MRSRTQKKRKRTKPAVEGPKVMRARKPRITCLSFILNTTFSQKWIGSEIFVWFTITWGHVHARFCSPADEHELVDCVREPTRKNWGKYALSRKSMLGLSQQIFRNSSLFYSAFHKMSTEIADLTWYTGAMKLSANKTDSIQRLITKRIQIIAHRSATMSGV